MTRTSGSWCRLSLKSTTVLVLGYVFLSACSSTGEYPNPIADSHARKIREKCESTPAITIKGEVLSKGILFHGTWWTRSPELELLTRRLTFLEINSRPMYSSFSVADRDDLQTKGVTRYYFADANSEDCKEFNQAAKRSPFTLIPYRRLGLPANLCIAKKVNVRPESKYFHYIEDRKSAAPFGEDSEQRQTLADFNSMEAVAQVVGFHYCDRPMCWHGFTCRRDEEIGQLLRLPKGIPDDRLGPIPTIEIVPPRPFGETRQARLVLTQSSPAASKTLPQSGSGNRNATTNPDATVYITEVYEPRLPQGSFSLVGYALEVIHAGRPRQVRIRAFDKEFDNPSTLRVSSDHITFMAAPMRSEFRQLNEVFFRYSREGEPLSAITLKFENFEKDPKHKYYFDEAKLENSKLTIVLLEASIDDHHDITVLKRHVFHER